MGVLPDGICILVGLENVAIAYYSIESGHLTCGAPAYWLCAISRCLIIVGLEYTHQRWTRWKDLIGAPPVGPFLLKLHEFTRRRGWLFKYIKAYR